MRAIILRYDGACRVCGAELAAGAEAIHERRVGIWCPGCAPEDPEAVRAARTEAADRRAVVLEERAASRRGEAEALERRNDPYRGDVAFFTQPGPVPQRARAIKRTERAAALSGEAADMERRARSLRSGVRVKGDAARRRAETDERVRAWLRVGGRCRWMGTTYRVLKVSRRTATVEGRYIGRPLRIALHLLEPIEEVRA